MNVTKGILMFAVMVLFAIPSFAEETAMEEGMAVEAKEVGNKICPTEGAEIGSMGEGVKVEHEGKIYNLCCESCLAAFKENPEKYHKIADKEVGIGEEGNHEDSGHDESKEDGHNHE